MDAIRMLDDLGFEKITLAAGDIRYRVLSANFIFLEVSFDRVLVDNRAEECRRTVKALIDRYPGHKIVFLGTADDFSFGLCVMKKPQTASGLFFRAIMNSGLEIKEVDRKEVIGWEHLFPDQYCIAGMTKEEGKINC